jgi:hypothetical protein
MTKNFSFNFNTNFSVNGKRLFSNSANDKKDLTPQQEYWLNRMLRDYGGKVLFISVLFMIFLFAVIVVADNGNQNSKSGTINTQIEVGK